MKLQEATQIVGRFTDTAIFSPEKTYFSDMMFEFFGCLTTDIEQELGMYEDIANFNKMLSLFNNPEILYEDEKLLIKEGKQKAYFMTSDINLIRRDIDPREQIEKTLQAPVVFEMQIDDELSEKIRKGLSTITNSKFIITSKDQEVQFTAKDTDMLGTDSNSFVLSVDGQAKQDFNIQMNQAVLTKMPKGEFTLKLVYSERTGTYRTVLEQQDLLIVLPTQDAEV